MEFCSFDKSIAVMLPIPHYTIGFYYFGIKHDCLDKSLVYVNHKNEKLLYEKRTCAFLMHFKDLQDKTQQDQCPYKT